MPGAIAGGRPAVAVVVPCYRQAHLLGAALDSVRAQTHPVAECIVVDDGSPDDVPGVVAAYPEVRLLRQRNRGLSAARNAGLRAAEADLITFLDSDDVLFPDGVAQGVAALADCPACAFAAGGYAERFPGDAVAAERRPALAEPAYPAMLRWNFIGMHGAVLYRRAALAAIGGFRESLASCEDYDVYLRLLARGDVALHPTIVAEYRRQPNGLSAHRGRMLATALSALRAQAGRARGDAHLWAAYQAGLAALRDSYGEQLLEGTRQAVGRGPRGWPAAARALLDLAAADGRHYATRFTRAALRRVLGRRPRSGV